MQSWLDNYVNLMKRMMRGALERNRVGGRLVAALPVLHTKVKVIMVKNLAKTKKELKEFREYLNSLCQDFDEFMFIPALKPRELKRFKMNEEFCKKSEKGALEYPSCSVCLTEIAKNEPTLLIPCGHMFHDGCINKWLEMHNTCPVCRYELPTDDQDYEGARQGRSQNGSPNFNRNRENENVNPNIMQNINANASPRRF